MDNILELLGRERELFAEDMQACETPLAEAVRAGRFLVLGGAGTIGQAVVQEIYRRGPRALHVVDLSENNLIELERDLRGAREADADDFRTFALDCGSREFDAMTAELGPYDYVLNFSALKHVRSEKDPLTLMRMIEVNILNTEKTAAQAAATGARKYFCVATDKAAGPVNMMGASKRIMEMFLLRRSPNLPVSLARCANVAFSDGSLLYGFTQRISKRQPIAAPSDVRRYFMTPQEASQLCLLSCLLGENRDIFFPKPDPALWLMTFPELAARYLKRLGYEPHVCASEDEARGRVEELARRGKWPCYFQASGADGEKNAAPFHAAGATLDLDRFQGVGVIKNEPVDCEDALLEFGRAIAAMRSRGNWSQDELVALFTRLVPELKPLEMQQDLDRRM